MRQERLDFGRTHVQRMPLVVEQYEPAHPIDIADFGSHAVLLEVNAIPHMLPQAWLGSCHRALPGGFAFWF
jgi:hypothetical protein